ncbi:MAG: M3 family metallopeptidase [Oceanococcus sp.]
MTNPLVNWNGPTPPWDKIQPEHLEPAVDAIIEQNRVVIQQIESQTTNDWNNTAALLEQADNRLHKAFQPGAHLHSVHNTQAWRDAYEACLPKLTQYSSEIGQNHALYRAYQALSEHPDLDTEQRQVIHHALRDFKLSGVSLETAAKQRFQEIQLRLADLTNVFERNLLDETDAWAHLIEDENALAGIPNSARQQAQAKALAKEKKGWLFGLDFPSFDAVMTYADDRQWRELTYRAYTTRASELAPDNTRDNAPLMEEILSLRTEQAQLLGYDNYAQVSLASKMAESPEQVEQFLLDMAAKARPAAEKELRELQDFASTLNGPSVLKPWDVAYYSEKLKQQIFGLEDEQLKPYFALPQVLEGLFHAAKTLFGVTLKEQNLPVWHEHVRSFEVRNTRNDVIAWFYLDPYAREQKRGGAWMNDMAGRMHDAHGMQLPIATLTCNSAPPNGDKPALLTHDDAVTLFHEFGHGLQHMLTQVSQLSVSGINGVPWDAVELPSQFMENWCWEEESLQTFARHYESGEPIPTDWIQQIRASRRFHAGLGAVRQVELALFDLRLHKAAGNVDVQATLDQVRNEVAVLTPPSWNRFANSFSHIFAGGYAAGYYSYKWAEVLAADAFEAFQEAGIFDPATGQRFRECILEPGGSEDAMELFKRFRGRAPQVYALLRQDGLLEDVA